MQPVQIGSHMNLERKSLKQRKEEARRFFLQFMSGCIVGSLIGGALSATIYFMKQGGL